MRILPPCLGKLLQEHLKHLSWRGWVWLPPGTVLTPLFQGFGAGEELGCREKALFWLWTDPIWRVATQVVLAVTGLAAEGCGTSTLARPSWWHLLPHWHCCPSVSAIPASLLSLGMHRAGTALSPPPAAAPLRCSHQTQHVFKSLSIFNENFCVYAFLGLGASVFWSPPLFGFSWDRRWLRVPVSPGEVGGVVRSWPCRRHCGRIPAHPNPWQHIPVPAVPAHAAARDRTWRDPCFPWMFLGCWLGRRHLETPTG